MNTVHYKFIEYLAYGYDMMEIKEKLPEHAELNSIKDEVKKELNVDNTLNVIFKAYKKKLFLVDDYFKNNLKRIAFSVAYNIYQDKWMNDNRDNLKEIYRKTFIVYKKIESCEQIDFLTKNLFLKNMSMKNNKSEVLTKQEEYYLKLLVHNCSETEINTFLETNEEGVQVIDKQVKDKLHTKKCYDTIIKAFKLNILNEYDFVHEVVKKEAIKATSLLEFFYKTNKLDRNAIRNLVKEMLKNTKIEMKSFYTEYIYIENISKEEVNYLKLMFEEHNRFYIRKELKVSIFQVFYEFKKLLFKKLKVNCYYNAYKRAFELGLFNDAKEEYHEQLEVRKTTNAIQEMIGAFEGKEKFQNEKVYRLFVACYNNIQYKILHKVYRKVKITIDAA